MSSHRISASGARPFSLFAGGGAATGMQLPSKDEDGAKFTLGSAGRVEIPVFGDVRLEKRKVMRKVGGDGREEEHVIDVLVIAQAGSLNVHVWPTPGPGMIHTNLDVRKPGENFGPTDWYAVNGGSCEVIDSIPLTNVAAEQLAEEVKMTDAGGGVQGEELTPPAIRAGYARLRQTYRFVHLYVAAADEDWVSELLHQDGEADNELRALTIVAADPALEPGQWRLEGADVPGA